MVLMGFLDIRNTKSVNTPHAIIDSMKKVILRSFSMLNVSKMAVKEKKTLLRYGNSHL